MRPFPKRKPSGVIAVEGISNFDDLVEVANRTWVAATAVRDRTTTATVVVELRTSSGPSYITGDRNKVFQWLSEARTVGHLLHALRSMPMGRRYRFILTWREANPMDLKGNPAIGVIFPQTERILREAEDDAKSVLREHNALLAQIVRGSLGH